VLIGVALVSARFQSLEQSGQQSSTLEYLNLLKPTKFEQNQHLHP
jgi:hypothetical protein